MSSETKEQAVEKLVDYLFRNGFGETADTLQLTDKNGCGLGGWSRLPVRDVIADAYDAGYRAGDWRRVDKELPIDVVLFCPKCKTQHIDKAEPDVCESCGKTMRDHLRSGYDSFACPSFKAWLNPPHKSHRCHNCNTVWRPADVPTNGVEKAKTFGSNDTKVGTSPNKPHTEGSDD